MGGGVGKQATWLEDRRLGWRAGGLVVREAVGLEAGLEAAGLEAGGVGGQAGLEDRRQGAGGGALGVAPEPAPCPYRIPP